MVMLMIMVMDFFMLIMLMIMVVGFLVVIMRMIMVMDFLVGIVLMVMVVGFLVHIVCMVVVMDFFMRIMRVVVIMLVFHTFDDFFRNRVDHLNHANRLRRFIPKRFNDPRDPGFIFTADRHEKIRVLNRDHILRRRLE